MEDFLSSLPLPDNAVEMLAHFFSELITILALFFIITAVVSFLSSLPFLSRFRQGLKDRKSAPLRYALAVGAGLLSPFCSCTIVPVFAGLLAVGVPTGCLFTFLTVASTMNLTTLATLFLQTDRVFFFTYLAFAFTISLISGLVPWLYDIRGQNKGLSLCECDCHCGHHHDSEHHHAHDPDLVENASFSHRLHHALKDTIHVLKEIWLWVILSLVISSLLAHLTPAGFLGGGSAPILLLLAVFFGILVHPDVFSVLPFLTLFLESGRNVAMVFLLFAMSISIPGLLLMCKALKVRSVLLYAATLLLLAAVFSLPGYLLL